MMDEVRKNRKGVEIMLVLLIVIVISGLVLAKWLKPLLEYLKIGSYSEYKCVSKTLGDYDDKDIEYSWYQVNGFKNINEEAIKYLRRVSKSCTKNDLKWLNQCSEFLVAGVSEALKDHYVNKLYLSDPIEKESLLEILKVIKVSRKPLTEYYRGMGCTTCGEAVVLNLWIQLRIQQIKNGEAIKAGDLDYVIDAVKEVKTHSK